MEDQELAKVHGVQPEAMDPADDGLQAAPLGALRQQERSQGGAGEATLVCEPCDTSAPNGPPPPPKIKRQRTMKPGSGSSEERCIDEWHGHKINLSFLAAAGSPIIQLLRSRSFALGTKTQSP